MNKQSLKEFVDKQRAAHAVFEKRNAQELSQMTVASSFQVFLDLWDFHGECQMASGLSETTFSEIDSTHRKRMGKIFSILGRKWPLSKKAEAHSSKL